MTPLASREMTEQEMINTCTAPQMAHLIQVLRQTIRNKDKEIEKWVDMVKQLQRDDELDPPAKPLLAEAKAGWICEQRNGSYSQIKAFGDSWGTDDCFNPNLFTVFLADNTTRNIYGTYLGTMVNPSPLDIVSCEPLAPEGSAEWALQMMKLGSTVTKQHLQDSGNVYWCFCDRLRCVQEFNCGTLQIMVTPEIWVKTADKCGWQLYEPKPEPSFAVGDVVRHHSSPYDCGVGYIVEIDGNNACVFFVDNMDTDVVSMSELSRCNPSEVIVKIGCLEGTVSQCGDKEEEVFALHTKNNAAVIPFAMLDPDTAALVKALLKAQEEK